MPEYITIIDTVSHPKPDPGIAGVIQFTTEAVVRFHATDDIAARRRVGRLAPKAARRGKRFPLTFAVANAPSWVFEIERMEKELCAAIQAATTRLRECITDAVVSVERPPYADPEIFAEAVVRASSSSGDAKRFIDELDAFDDWWIDTAPESWRKRVLVLLG